MAEKKIMAEFWFLIEKGGMQEQQILII